MKKENKNNKKILARVGAMVAAVLLVVLCALPVFADYYFTVGDVVRGIVTANALQDYDPVKALITTNRYDPQEYPFIIQFTLPEVGTVLTDIEYKTMTGEPIEWGVSAITQFTGSAAGMPGFNFDYKTYMTTSHTSSGTNKFVYFDIYSIEGRAIRMRIKIDTTTNTVTETTVTGDKQGDGSDFIFAFVCPKDMLDVFYYGISNGLLNIGDGKGLFIEYEVFRQGFATGGNFGYQQGYVEGESVGYDAGMENSSLMQMVTGIFRAPMDLIDGVLNFEIFGINMAVAVRVLITMAIIGVCVTIVWKAVK